MQDAEGLLRLLRPARGHEDVHQFERGQVLLEAVLFRAGEITRLAECDLRVLDLPLVDGQSTLRAFARRWRGRPAGRPARSGRRTPGTRERASSSRRSIRARSASSSRMRHASRRGIGSGACSRHCWR